MTATGGSGFGSDLIVRMLGELGITELAMNPGATIRGLHDSAVHDTAAGVRLVTCLHEDVAVAVAHGYARATGRPMAVGLHDTVGLLHGAMALFNAWVDRSPMVVLVGTGPLDTERRRPWLDWIHTVNDQGELVREFTVWNSQPTSIPALRRSLQRAWRAAVGTPGGPAVVAVDVELQEATGVDLSFSLDPDARVVSRVAPDPAVVAEVARRLLAAERPLFVTDRQLGEGASRALVDIAERAGAAVYDMGMGNIPVGHPHDVTDQAADALTAADLIVFVDVRDPGWALGKVDLASRGMSGEGVGTRAVSIGVEELIPSSWMVTRGDRPGWLALTADPELGLRSLAGAWDAPRRPLPAVLAGLTGDRARWHDPEEGIGRGLLARAVADAVGGRDYVIANGVLRGATRRAFRPETPSRFLGIQEGAGQGYGLPASVGAALGLAGSGRLVVDLQADGDLLYAPQALWTLAHLRLPLLVVVDANRRYGQDALHQKVMERERGRARIRPMPGIDIADPPVDIAALARSFGIAAEGPVGAGDELGPALERAVEKVVGGEPALVEVLTVED